LYFTISSGYCLLKSFTFIHFFLVVVCILWCWLWQWSHISQIFYWFLYLFMWFSYFLKEQETIYCFSIFNQNRISCYDIYYQRDCLVTLVSYRYKSFFFSSHSHVLWQTRVLFRLPTTHFFHEQTKHIKINSHLTRHHLKPDTITLPFVYSSL
jgi:hypothetical protein